MKFVAAFEFLYWFDRSRLEFTCVPETYGIVLRGFLKGGHIGLTWLETVAFL